jgi:DNA (cytosine-5)-methyltransferase 1
MFFNNQSTSKNSDFQLKYIDLFCGIGGFRIALELACSQYKVKDKKIEPICVFSSDIDADAQINYETNFKDKPQGDITKISVELIPKHDLLLAGFPCQPFSICGQLQGFEDTRGTLFFEIARILDYHKPYAFILENVKQLVGHNQGKTLNTILDILFNLGYYTEYKVLNALEFGLPQKRERVFIVGFRDSLNFMWKKPNISMKPLSEILEKLVPEFYYASEQIQKNRLAKYQGNHHHKLTIWHENKAGHISAYPYSCAMRSGASYNYLLVNGKRRLTEREMLRLQGFPDSFKLIGSYSTARKLVGNSVAVPCVVSIINSVFDAVKKNKLKVNKKPEKLIQTTIFNQIMTTDIEKAKARLDKIINKSRTRFYKPIQIAEVLYNSRIDKNIDTSNKEDYRIKSKLWRDQVTDRLLKHSSTSSSRFQDDIWNDNAMPPEILKILDDFNKNYPGVVERYIYFKFKEKLGIIASIMEVVVTGVSSPENFQLENLLSLFRQEAGIKRSIDKCYEIITYSLFQTVVNQLEAEITVKIPKKNYPLLQEFSDLSQVLLNVSPQKQEWTELAHIYRVGVTNAADRGLDMWANFGPVIQVKHLTLNSAQVETIVDQVESDNIIIVCRDADASVISILMKQIGWGKRVRGIVKESQLIEWYNRCLKGEFSHQLSQPLMNLLQQGFDEEFPEVTGIMEFCQERKYTDINLPEAWQK